MREKKEKTLAAQMWAEANEIEIVDVDEEAEQNEVEQIQERGQRRPTTRSNIHAGIQHQNATSSMPTAPVQMITSPQIQTVPPQGEPR